MASDHQDRKLFNQALFDWLLGEGVQEPLARELAAECGPGTEVEVGGRTGERVLVWPGVPPKKPTP